MNHRLLIVCLLIFNLLFSSYSWPNIDSLKHCYQSQQTDSASVETLRLIYEEYWDQGIYDSTFKYANEAAQKAQKINYELGAANAHNQLAMIDHVKGNYPQAIKGYFKAIKFCVSEDMQIKKAMIEGNIANVYIRQQNYRESVEYLLSALKLFTTAKETRGMAVAANNIGICYDNLNKKDSAIFYYQQALATHNELNNELGVANCYTNIGMAYHDLKEYDKAKQYQTKALDLKEKLNDKRGLVFTYTALGKLFHMENKHTEAIEYFNKAITMANEMKSSNGILDAYHFISITYEAKKQYAEALESFKKYTLLKDSIFNESKSKEIGKLEATYEMEKKQAEEERLNIENLKLEIEKKQRRDNIQYSVIFIAILVVFGTILSLGFIKISPKFAEGLIFFAFLIFFEFCLVLLDPFVDNYSEGEPAYKLLFNAILAGAIFPAHAFFERLLKKKIMKTV